MAQKRSTNVSQTSLGHCPNPMHPRDACDTSRCIFNCCIRFLIVQHWAFEIPFCASTLCLWLWHFLLVCHAWLLPLCVDFKAFHIVFPGTRAIRPKSLVEQSFGWNNLAKTIQSIFLWLARWEPLRNFYLATSNQWPFKTDQTSQWWTIQINDEQRSKDGFFHLTVVWHPCLFCDDRLQFLWSQCQCYSKMYVAFWCADLIHAHNYWHAKVFFDELWWICGLKSRAFPKCKFCGWNNLVFMCFFWHTKFWAIEWTNAECWWQ